MIKMGSENTKGVGAGAMGWRIMGWRIVGKDDDEGGG